MSQEFFFRNGLLFYLGLTFCPVLLSTREGRYSKLHSCCSCSCFICLFWSIKWSGTSTVLIMGKLFSNIMHIKVTTSRGAGIEVCLLSRVFNNDFDMRGGGSRGPQNIFCLVYNVFPEEFVLWSGGLLLSKNATKKPIWNWIHYKRHKTDHLIQYTILYFTLMSVKLLFSWVVLC